MGQICVPGSDNDMDKDLLSSDEDYDITPGNINTSIDSDDDSMDDDDRIKFAQTILKQFQRLCIKKDLSKACSMIEEYGNNTNFEDHYFNNGDTILHCAVRQTDIKTVYYLLQMKGFDVCGYVSGILKYI